MKKIVFIVASSELKFIKLELIKNIRLVIR